MPLRSMHRLPTGAAALAALAATAIFTFAAAPVQADGQYSSLPLFPGDMPGVYFVEALVGQQRFRLMPDSYAGFVGIPTRDCDNCGYRVDSAYVESSTYQPYPCEGNCLQCSPDNVVCTFANTNYSDPQLDPQGNASRDSLIGHLGSERLLLGEIVMTQTVAFFDSMTGFATARNYIDGVLGLGLFGSCNPTCVPGVLESPEMLSVSYGLCLRADGTGGVLDLGLTDPTRYDAGTMQYASGLNGFSDPLAMSFQGTTVGPYNVSAAPSYAVLDLATPYLHLPHDAYVEVLSLFANLAPPGFTNGSTCFGIDPTQMSQWPAVNLTMYNRHPGAPPVSISLQPAAYLFASPSSAPIGGFPARCLAIFDAQRSRTRAQSAAVTLGTLALVGNYVVVSRGSQDGSVAVQFGVAPAVSCPSPGFPSPGTNPNPPDGQVTCTPCALGSGSCSQVMQASSAAQCEGLQANFRSFDSLGLGEGCRSTFGMWSCGAYSALSVALAQNNCSASTVTVPQMCTDSCAEFRRQISECNGGDAWAQVSYLCAGGGGGPCLHVNVTDPYVPPANTSSCTDCVLQFCPSGPQHVWALDQAQCASFQSNVFLPGVPASCMPVLETFSCEYYSKVGQVLKATSCQGVIDWNATRLCQSSCSALISDVRACAGDQFDPNLESVCESKPTGDCIYVGLPPDTGISGTGTGFESGTGTAAPVVGCYPCHFNTCPADQHYFAGSMAECNALKGIQVPDSEITSADCRTQVDDTLCRLYGGYSQYVLSHDCDVQLGAVNLCADTCKQLDQVMATCTTLGQMDCSNLPTTECVSIDGTLVTTNPSKGGGGSAVAAIVGGVVGGVAVLGVVILYFSKRRRSSSSAQSASSSRKRPARADRGDPSLRYAVVADGADVSGIGGIAPMLEPEDY